MEKEKVGKKEVKGEFFMDLKMEVGRPSDNPLRDCYDIGSDICRLMCVSSDPLHDIRYLVDVLGKLWDQHKTVLDNEVKKVVLKVND